MFLVMGHHYRVTIKNLKFDSAFWTFMGLNGLTKNVLNS